MQTKASTDQAKKITLKIESSPNDMKAVAADLVTFESVNGYMVMNFLQTFPDENRNSKNTVRRGLVTARVMLSWEHFTQMFSRMSMAIKTSEENAEKRYTVAKQIANNITVTGTKNGK